MLSFVAVDAFCVSCTLRPQQKLPPARTPIRRIHSGIGKGSGLRSGRRPRRLSCYAHPNDPETRHRFKLHTGFEPADPRSEAECSPLEQMQYMNCCLCLSSKTHCVSQNLPDTEFHVFAVRVCKALSAIRIRSPVHMMLFVLYGSSYPDGIGCRAKRPGSFSHASRAKKANPWGPIPQRPAFIRPALADS